MFLFIEVVAAVVASARGWGARPFAIVGASFLLGIFLGMTGMINEGTVGFMTLFDVVITLSLIVMAITGKKKEEQITIATAEAENRVKCPKCAELIMPEAKVCRFCGHELQAEKGVV